MHYNDWKDQFSTLFLNVDFPEVWTGVRFKSAWTTSNSAGLPAKYEQKHLERYAKNPQFLLKPLEDTEVMFSMQQTGGRLPLVSENNEYKYSVYPFQEQLYYGNVSVFKLDNNNLDYHDGSLYLKSFDKDNLVVCTPLKRERENTGRCKLKKGCMYILVCSTEKPKQKGEFYLSVYFN